MLLRDRLQRRLAAMGPCPDYVALAAEVMSIRVPDPAMARRLVEQALVIGDRQDAWRRLGERLRAELPESAGVYVMRDAEGAAVYVGKAANLRRRVLSYFAARRWCSLPPGLPSAETVEWRAVGSDLEALLVEADLITQLAPRVNLQVSAPRASLKRRPARVRDLIVVLPCIDSDCVELVAARVDHACLRQRTRRDGRDLAVHTRRLTRFFRPVSLSTHMLPEPGGLGSIVFAWLAAAGRHATRVDPHDAATLQGLRTRLSALLADPDLFRERIDQRGLALGADVG